VPPRHAAAHAWAPGVTISSDQAYLTGKKVPPLTPNIVGVRIRNFEVGVEIER
jgi:hypothetical protein